MYFSSLQDWLHMGGYAGYVWPAYGIALIVLAAIILIPLYRQKKLQDTDEGET